MRKLFVVRHADAGHRSDWDGPDHLRALTKRGRRQAAGLVGLLEDEGITRLFSSPYVRCVETLEPLGARLGVPVEPDDRIAEGKGADGALAIADEVRHTAAVLCSHGDVIPDLLEALVRQGARLQGELLCRKGSTWVLSWDGGPLPSGRYLPPPS